MTSPLKKPQARRFGNFSEKAKDVTAQRQIQRERRMMEAEREGTSDSPASTSRNGASGTHDDDNPLLEQMNIIRDYIKEARREMRFEEVAILETNLKELKKEYQLQMLSHKMN